jgi:hypothetical protein
MIPSVVVTALQKFRFNEDPKIRRRLKKKGRR